MVFKSHAWRSTCQLGKSVLSGLIGVSCSVEARYSAFSECLANLSKPDGAFVLFKPGIDIGANRNAIVRHALSGQYDWVWFVDDDMAFVVDHLEHLLSHNQPVVASLYLNRKPPIFPVAFNRRTEVEGQPVWQPISLAGAPNHGLAEIIAAGTGGMLVRSEVFRAIEYDTWFDHHQSTDDLAFCQRVHAAGFPIFLDLGATMGHISTYEVWPVRQDQQGWGAQLRLTDKDFVPMRLGD